jgi:excisionase family DNA binding protein
LTRTPLDTWTGMEFLRHATPLASTRFPEDSGVYVIFCGRECLYIGQTTNLCRRLANQCSNSQWKLQLKELQVAWTIVNLPELRARERALIEKLQPRLNRQWRRKYCGCGCGKRIPLHGTYAGAYASLRCRRRGVKHLTGIKPINTEQAAELLEISIRNVLSLLYTGKLRGWRVGRNWRLYPSDIEEYVQSQRQKVYVEAQEVGVNN